MAAYLNYTLRMKTLFCGQQVMVHDTHTRRRMHHCALAVFANTIKDKTSFIASLYVEVYVTDKKFAFVVCEFQLIKATS